MSIITLVDFAACDSDSSRRYFNSADVPLLPHFNQCLFPRHEQNAIVVRSSNRPQSASLCIWRRRVLWHRRGKHEEQSAHTGCLL